MNIYILTTIQYVGTMASEDRKVVLATTDSRLAIKCLQTLHKYDVLEIWENGKQKNVLEKVDFPEYKYVSLRHHAVDGNQRFENEEEAIAYLNGL